MPATASRKEWARLKQDAQLLRELGEEEAIPRSEVARCWSCEILIGVNRLQSEVWFYPLPGKKGLINGAIVCGGCADDLHLDNRYLLAQATTVEALPHQQRWDWLWTQATPLLGVHPGRLLSGSEAINEIRRARPAGGPDAG